MSDDDDDPFLVASLDFFFFLGGEDKDLIFIITGVCWECSLVTWRAGLSGCIMGELLSPNGFLMNKTTRRRRYLFCTSAKSSVQWRTESHHENKEMNNLIQAPELLPAGEVSHPPLTCNPVFHCGLCVVVANAVVSPPYFCPGGDKFSPGKHRLLLPGRGMQKGSLERQTYLPLAWLQRDTAAVWPLMTGRRTRLTHRPTNSAATNLFVPAQCVHTSRRPRVLCESLNGQQKAKMQLLSSPNSKYVLTVGVGATCAASCNETANCWLLIYMCVCVCSELYFLEVWLWWRCH